MVSITNLRKVNNAARLAGRTLLWFMITSLIAVVIGLVIGLVSNPGSGSSLTPADGAKPDHAGSWLDFLTGILPTDVVTPFVQLNVLQIVFMAVVAGIAILKIGPKAQPILTLSESVLELLQKALWWVILLAPIGSAGLIGRAIVQYGWDLLGNYATFTADIYIGCAWSSSASTRCCSPSPASSTRCSSSRAPGPPSSSASSPAPRSAPCRSPSSRRSISRPEGVRLLRRAVRRDDEDGRLRGDLPGHLRDLRGPDLRRPARDQGVPADRLRLGDRLGGDRRSDGRDGHADADPVHPGSADGGVGLLLAIDRSWT